MVDESVDQAIAIALRKNGHKVEYITELSPSISDLMVLDLANKSNSLVITADKDFGELVFRHKYVNPGIILIRLSGLSQQQKVDTVLNAVNQHDQYLFGKFSVISPFSIRIRKFKYQ